MELIFLNYVALFYVLIIYTAWKRWYLSLRAGGGRKSMKRLERCAPRVLFRALRNQQYCQYILQACDAVYCVSSTTSPFGCSTAVKKNFIKGARICAFVFILRNFMFYILEETLPHNKNHNLEARIYGILLRRFNVLNT